MAAAQDDAAEGSICMHFAWCASFPRSLLYMLPKSFCLRAGPLQLSGKASGRISKFRISRLSSQLYSKWHDSAPVCLGDRGS